ncbi:hypothetical protein [Streptosporangium sp. NPDC006930]|uniref:hypothetical protein n=1 Tax=unclassified Streptosporangium TaxID=2632669 RepID=UPI00344AF3F8
MTPEEFEILFRPSMRVLFDWGRLKNLHLGIHVEVVPDADKASGWYAPWYTVEEQAEDYARREPPFRFGDALRKPETVSKRRLSKAAAIADAHRKRPQVMLVAAYDFGSGTIVLDGNHRVLAALLHFPQNPIMAVKISGGIDPKILPDLANVDLP